MDKKVKTDEHSPKELRKAPLRTPTDLESGATRDVAAAMNGVLADVQHTLHVASAGGAQRDALENPGWSFSKVGVTNPICASCNCRGGPAMGRRNRPINVNGGINEAFDFRCFGADCASYGHFFAYFVRPVSGWG